MITTINNKHNKLNVPNKREQNQTCLDSAEREGLSPKGNVPTLRFPEFQGEWEKHELGDICETITDFVAAGSFASLRENVKYYQEDNYAQLVRTVDLKKDFTNNDFVYVDELAYDFLWRVQLKEPNIILPNIGANIGEKYYVSPEDLPKEKNVLGPNAILLRSKCNDTHFVYFRLSTSSYDNEMKKLVGASGQPKFNKTDLKKVRLFMPSLKEQKKISHFLGLLEERIATQNKIIDKLQSLIKGIEDNLLDNPLWEKTYLRSFMQFFPTNSLSWEQLSYKEGAIRNLHYGLIHGFQTRGINSASLPMIKNEAVPKQYISCQVGDVAFADASEDTGEIAKSVEFVDTIEGDTICGLHTIHGRDIKNRTVVGFKGFAFNSRYFHNQIKRLAQGTKVFSITANNLSSCYVYLPDLETQKAIVKLLRSYEEQLIIGRIILKQYEKQKQYLLRQMFI